MSNKRGLKLTPNVKLLIVVGFIFFAVLSIGWDKIAPWIKTGNLINFGGNVEEIIKTCQDECRINDVYDFCTKPRELKAADLPGNVRSVKNSCKFFATTKGYEKYGIQDCPICPKPSIS